MDEKKIFVCSECKPGMAKVDIPETCPRIENLRKTSTIEKFRNTPYFKMRIYLIIVRPLPRIADFSHP